MQETSKRDKTGEPVMPFDMHAKSMSSVLLNQITLVRYVTYHLQKKSIIQEQLQQLESCTREHAEAKVSFIHVKLLLLQFFAQCLHSQS